MINRVFLLIFSTVVLLFSSCGIFDRSAPSPSEKTTPAYNDYIFIDTTRSILLKMDVGAFRPSAESYLWWEYVIGEPYTDINGNGVFDRGIDIFIRSTGDDNNDLNHNGKYDGPCDAFELSCTWTPGVPFDDIDGDGDRRFDNNHDYYFSTYEPGVPFCDFNQNGVWDSIVEHDLYDMVRCSSYVGGNDTLVHGFFDQDKAFIFISDSGIYYYFETYAPSDGYVLDRPMNNLKFGVHSFGFIYHYRYFRLPVLDAGDLLTDTNLIDTTFLDDKPLVFTRSINFYTTLSVDDTVYNDLLMIHCHEFMRNGNPYSENLFFTFFFSPDYGLLTFEFWDRDRIRRYYFDTRFDTMPVPMTR